MMLLELLNEVVDIDTDIFRHAKLHFTAKYTSEGSNGDSQLSVLNL